MNNGVTVTNYTEAVKYILWCRHSTLISGAHSHINSSIHRVQNSTLSLYVHKQHTHTHERQHKANVTKIHNSSLYIHMFDLDRGACMCKKSSVSSENFQAIPFHIYNPFLAFHRQFSSSPCLCLSLRVHVCKYDKYITTVFECGWA